MLKFQIKFYLRPFLDICPLLIKWLFDTIFAVLDKIICDIIQNILKDPFCVA